MTTNFDRAAVRAMIEDNFRATTIADMQGQRQLGTDINERFCDHLEAMAALMPAAQAESFRTTVDEECRLIVDEFKRDRQAGYRRLGIALPQGPVTHYHRQGIGEMAARTAVRATIWEVIFRLFR